MVLYTLIWNSSNLINTSRDTHICPAFGIYLFPKYLPDRLVVFSFAAYRKMEEKCLKTESLEVWPQSEVFRVSRLKPGERRESPLLAGLHGTENSKSHIT
jgi:hypothetical protein